MTKQFTHENTIPLYKDFIFSKEVNRLSLVIKNLVIHTLEQIKANGDDETPLGLNYIFVLDQVFLEVLKHNMSLMPDIKEQSIGIEGRNESLKHITQLAQLCEVLSNEILKEYQAYKDLVKEW